MKYGLTILLTGLLLLFAGCQKPAEGPQERSFYLGVTPWPADFTIQ